MIGVACKPRIESSPADAVILKPQFSARCQIGAVPAKWPALVRSSRYSNEPSARSTGNPRATAYPDRVGSPDQGCTYPPIAPCFRAARNISVLLGYRLSIADPSYPVVNGEMRCLVRLMKLMCP